MSEEDFRARLAALGVQLDERAFAAAFKAAPQLRSDGVRLEAYLAQSK